MNDIEKFKDWLRRRRAEIYPNMSVWEVLRWKLDGNTCVIYKNKRGAFSFGSADAAGAWCAFREEFPEEDAVDKAWRAAEYPPASPGPVLPAPTDPAEQANTTLPTKLTLSAPQRVGAVADWNVYDDQGRWVATIHGTHNGLPIPGAAALARLFAEAPQTRQEPDALRAGEAA